MFKNKMLKKAVFAIGLSLSAIGIFSINSNNTASAATTSTNLTQQMFPVDYADQYSAGLQTDLTIQSYDLPSETDGYYRNFDQFLTRDMTTWLGSQNVAYAKKARNSWLTQYFLYRLSPANDDFGDFQNNVVPELKKNGGTANLKLQILNYYNSGQVLREVPITVHVPAPMSKLEVSFNASSTYPEGTSSSIFNNVYAMPQFTITDQDTNQSFQATNIKPTDNVYLDGKKVLLKDLPKTLQAGTYTQSIFFNVAGMSNNELSSLASNSRIEGNNGDTNIRYSNGQLIAARTIIIK